MEGPRAAASDGPGRRRVGPAAPGWGARGEDGAPHPRRCPPKQETLPLREAASPGGCAYVHGGGPATGMRGVPPARTAGPQRPGRPRGQPLARELPGPAPPPGPLPSPSPGSGCARGAPAASPGGTPPRRGTRPPLTRKPFSRSALISASSCFRAAVKPRKSRYSRTSSSVRSAAAAMGDPRRRQLRPPTGGEWRGGAARPLARRSGPAPAGLQLPECLGAPAQRKERREL